MAEVEFAFKKHYQSYFSTFKQTSLDDSDKNRDNEYLCKDESQEVIDFDKIIKNKYPDVETRPQSFDAIFINNQNIYCIEFKNQKSVVNSEIQGKLEDGKKELDIIFADINIKKDNYKFIYCVVYNKCKNNVSRYKCGLKQDEYKMSLLKYKEDGIVQDIYTENISFYTKEFKRERKKELKC